MKHLLVIPFLVLFSCANAQDETALFQEAFSAVFEYLSSESEFLSAEMGIMDPSVFSAFAGSLDDDLIRQDFNEPERKRFIAKAEFDIEQSISIWEKYRGKDLSAYVAEKHLHFLVPKDSPADRGATIGFSAPIFNSDTSLFFFYMVFETKKKNKESLSHQYMLFGKTEDLWHWRVESRVHEEN